MSAGRPPTPVDMDEVVVRFAAGEDIEDIAADFEVVGRTLQRRARSIPDRWQQAVEARTARRLKGHGTPARYKRGCRCDDCRAANTEKQVQWRRKARRGAPPERVHGTSGGYFNWACRCSDCKAAGSEYNARQYARRQS